MTDNKRGRPAAFGNIRVTPEFHEKPDVEKLARVLIAIAKKKAEQEQVVGSEGENMT
jgi:hypothetical protein